ncbi:hypothetical protein N2K86_19335 [Enterobacter mori]|uniref:hypothetical protein n=1 Tax=Enterobacter mori TaxID=539813 RepID=UPI0021B0E07C|nr:hypothetical protein [Enterobacter mori]UWX92776.1 hypothetical protein N2K86_19335 [Enterobacter mori]
MSSERLPASVGMVRATSCLWLNIKNQINPQNIQNRFGTRSNRNIYDVVVVADVIQKRPPVFSKIKENL